MGVNIQDVPQSGVFSYKIGATTNKPGAGSSGNSGLITFDASRSSSTYQDNAHVRPLSLVTSFFIRY